MADENGMSRPDYVRASKLRKKMVAGEEIDDDDQTWFESYESAKKKVGRPPIHAVNGSASEKITYTEERAAATGDHPHPIAYEGMVRAEGLRADTLLRIVADSLIRVNDQYANMNAHLLARTTAIEDAHVSMLETVREHFIARMEAESEAIQLQGMLNAGEAGEEGTLAQLIQYVMQAKAQKDAADAAMSPQQKRLSKLKAARKAKRAAKKKKPLGDPT